MSALIPLVDKLLALVSWNIFLSFFLSHSRTLWKNRRERRIFFYGRRSIDLLLHLTHGPKRPYPPPPPTGDKRRKCGNREKDENFLPTGWKGKVDRKELLALDDCWRKEQFYIFCRDSSISFHYFLNTLQHNTISSIRNISTYIERTFFFIFQRFQRIVQHSLMTWDFSSDYWSYTAYC